MPQTENNEDTLPTPVERSDGDSLGKTQRGIPKKGTSTSTSQTNSARPKRWKWLAGGLATLLVLVGLGALGGYQTGVFARQAQEGLQSAVEANFQFQMGLLDLQQGACQRAKDRFIYVIELVADYPRAQEKLIEASMCQGVSTQAAGQVEATEGPTATPDLRGAEQIFADAQGLLTARTWDSLLPLLDTLRKNFPDFQPIEVDRMYYIGLRNRGADRIVAGDLEHGIFDLNRAEKIGPLDAEAQNYRQWAIWYIVGLSFWEVDWPQAVQYFQYVAVAAPQLHDLNFISAEARLATAVVFYSEHLVKEAERLAAQKQWCSAQDMMIEANNISPLPPEVEPTATWYSDKCILDGNEER
ncbi:MAG TPA: hypothetical protein VIH14_03380 [Anaerolineales bacterium]